jgi:Xaa-Pro aminopeptidase
MLKRINALRKQLDNRGLDGMLVGHAPNRKYLSGFTGSAGWILISRKRALLAVDFRYVEQAKLESPDFETCYIKTDITDWLPKYIADLGISRVGIEADFMPVSQYQLIIQSLKDKAPAVQIVPVKNVTESIRLYKDSNELECIQKACEIADEAVAYIQSHLHAGISEKQFAWELESFMRQNKSETMPFEIIVASGVNSALPHARPGDKVIMEGEPVTIDMGARYNGYCSDITRTFIIGKEDNNFNNIYNIVLSAQAAGLSLIKPDMGATVADGLVRSMISNAGYGDNFGHGLGHGIGIETHELPRLGTKSEDKLEEGMVFTIEPGIYLPGWGGVRIEDTVTIKDGKVICLTKSNKNALIVGG